MKSHPLYLSLSDAKPHLRDADIVLFRGRGPISKIIQVFSSGIYTHVGIISATHPLELLEIREFRGGRRVSLQEQVEEWEGRIDVYRAAGYRRIYSFNNNRVEEHEITLNRYEIVDCMRKLCGTQYNYWSIWQILKRSLPFVRWLYSKYNLAVDEPVQDSVSHICSSAVANCFTKTGYDLVINKGDELVTPNDIGKSAALSYLFSLVP